MSKKTHDKMRLEFMEIKSLLLSKNIESSKKKEEHSQKLENNRKKYKI
jgi:hypothetical protein